MGPRSSPRPAARPRRAILKLLCAAATHGPRLAESQDACSISAVFSRLTEIKSDANCMAGCAGGSGECPPAWYPSGEDLCSAECGATFEPFVSAELRTRGTLHLPLVNRRRLWPQWDQCGDMLSQAGMGGMEQMGMFYDRCLEALYPPGSCVSTSAAASLFLSLLS